MEAITRSVSDIDHADRQALEHLLGTRLSENQQVIIQVANVGVQPAEQQEPAPRHLGAGMLPEWCNVYEGLSDAEIADIEASIVRSHDSRFYRKRSNKPVFDMQS